MSEIFLEIIYTIVFIDIAITGTYLSISLIIKFLYSDIRTRTDINLILNSTYYFVVTGIDIGYLLYMLCFR